jgi:hypothetical protein
MDQARDSFGIDPPPSPPRRCAFCDAPFTARMTAWMGEPQPCACCEGAILAHWPIRTAARPPPVPTEDLACDACGRVLYLVPGKA